MFRQLKTLLMVKDYHVSNTENTEDTKQDVFAFSMNYERHKSLALTGSGKSSAREQDPDSSYMFPSSRIRIKHNGCKTSTSSPLIKLSNEKSSRPQNLWAVTDCKAHIIICAHLYNWIMNYVHWFLGDWQLLKIIWQQFW